MYEEADRLLRHCIQVLLVGSSTILDVSTNKVVPTSTDSPGTDAIAFIPKLAASASSSRTDRVKTSDVGIFGGPNLL